MDRSSSRWEAAAAVLALGLAVTAQAMLEAARWQRVPPPPSAAPLFAPAVLLAIIATWRHQWPASGARHLSVVVPAWPWLAACLPGCLCLLAATVLHAQSRFGEALVIWLVGVGLLLVPGIAHAVRQPHRRRTDDDGWSPRQVLLAYAVVAAVALAMRMAFGPDNLPAFVYSDEIELAMDAQVVGYDWFGTFWVGIPNQELVLIRAAQFLFGWSVWGLRMGPVVAGTVSVIATFAFGRRLIGNLPAFVGALLLAFAHTHIHWSRNIQPFVSPPLAAAVLLWLWTRAWTGGGLLSWIGAGIALGFGTPQYWSSHVFPLLIPLTALGWALTGGVDKRAALTCTAVVMLIGSLMFAPTAVRMWANSRTTLVRPASLFIFNPKVFNSLGENPYAALAEHAENTLAMFNSGHDFYPTYGARRSLVDCVTAALVPIAAALLLSRLFSPVGWLFATWWATFVVIGVFLTAHPPAYHRVPAALLFTSLGVAWALYQLLSSVRFAFSRERGGTAVAVACCLFALAAGVANAHFYFYEYWTTNPISRELGFVRLVCPYTRTHAVINATMLDGEVYVPDVTSLARIECPELQPVKFSNRSQDMWNVADFTQAEKAVLVLPKQIADAHPGTPLGYRVTKRYEDHSLHTPLETPLVIFELQRDSAAPAS